MMLLGAHMSIAGGLDKAIERGQSIGCTAIQIFTKNSNQWRTPPLREGEVSVFKTRRKSWGAGSVFAHDSYLINLGSPDEVLYRRSLSAFQDEYDRCETLGLDFLVMHPGAHVGAGEEGSLAQIARAVKTVLHHSPKGKTLILFETTAGQGSNVGHRFEHLHSLLDESGPPERLGVCFDTCHVFAAGYDLRTKKAYEETMKTFDATVGVNRIKAFHLNDSKKGLNCHVDRHEHIGKGAIGLEAFRALMNDKRFENIPKVLETPKGEDLEEDIMNLATLRRLVKKGR
ncbi:MAG: deoxyribonuclease IV [Candidatus Omnitrophica bacterium]|nr:deoxyribonuclease IV [Candidatus Omnitrophota bacterium]